MIKTVSEYIFRKTNENIIILYNKGFDNTKKDESYDLKIKYALNIAKESKDFIACICQILAAKIMVDDSEDLVHLILHKKGVSSYQLDVLEREILSINDYNIHPSSSELDNIKNFVQDRLPSFKSKRL